MKIALVPNNINNLDSYTKIGVKTFILGLAGFCINYPSISIKNIKRMANTFQNIEIFISINKTIFNHELPILEKQMIELNEIGIKGVLFYDLGVVSLYNKHNFSYSLVWHQTHMVTNYNTCNYYYDKGVEYGVLASEITKDEMIEINKKTPMKLFAFLIGYPIMAHSKRKLLTNYYNSLNQEYNGDIKIIEEHNNSYMIKETEDGTCIFENNILNGACYILELDSSKIEYGIINGFNMDESLLLKVVTLTQKIIDEKDSKTIEELKQLIGNNTGFFNKKTIFKVKKDEK